jgi:Endonuclease-reverse transcriptase
VALFYKSTNKSFTLEGTHTFGPNVIRTTLVSGNRRWTLIGAYIPPSETNNDTINYIQLATQHAHNHELVLLGDLNVNLNDMQRSNIRQDDTVALISSLGLQDLRQAFRIKYSSKWTWRQLRDNRYITSECDYILTTNVKDFKHIRIKTPNAYESDHRLVMTTMVLNRRQHKIYMNQRTRQPRH